MKTELEGRTKRCAVQVVMTVGKFPRNAAGGVLGRQLLKAATSIGANYREANRAESKDDFIHKVGVSEKEASETCYWLEICEAAHIGPCEEIKSLLQESSELLASLTTIGKNAKR